MKTSSAIILLFAFLVLHEGHALWSLAEEWGIIQSESEAVASATSAEAADAAAETVRLRYAFVADMTNSFAILLLALVMHRHTVGKMRLVAMFLSIYMGVQCMWLAADPERCDTIFAEFCTIAISAYFIPVYGWLERRRHAVELEFG